MHPKITCPVDLVLLLSNHCFSPYGASEVIKHTLIYQVILGLASFSLSLNNLKPNSMLTTFHFAFLALD